MTARSPGPTTIVDVCEATQWLTAWEWRILPPANTSVIAISFEGVQLSAGVYLDVTSISGDFVQTERGDFSPSDFRTSFGAVLPVSVVLLAKVGFNSCSLCAHACVCVCTCVHQCVSACVCICVHLRVCTRRAGWN